MNHIASFISGNSPFIFSVEFPRSTSDFSGQPDIKSLPENRLVPRIESHSIDYDFPLKIKSAPSGKPSSDKAIGTEIPLSTKGTDYKKTFATEPSYVASTPPKLVDSGNVGISEIEILSGPEELSGLTLNSFIESIKHQQNYSLSMHIDEGFKGHQLIMDGSAEKNAIECAVICKNIHAVNLLLPTTDRAILENVMNEHKDFFQDHPQFKLEPTQTS
jgi:hypothetical protein